MAMNDQNPVPVKSKGAANFGIFAAMSSLNYTAYASLRLFSSLRSLLAVNLRKIFAPRVRPFGFEQDCIVIEEMELQCIIGCQPAERVKPRAVLISLRLYADFDEVCHSDDLTHTINYQDVVAQLEQFVSQTQFMMIEKLAHESAGFLLKRYEKITSVWIRIEKPQALAQAAVAVEMRRGRKVDRI